MTALVFAIGGPVALAVPVLAWLGWLAARRLTSVPALAILAFAGMAVSGLLAAAQPSGSGLLGTFGGPAQACALVALAAALIPAALIPPASVLRAQPGLFGVVDELSCYFDSEAEPNNVHLEVWLPGRLDEARLREAVGALLASQAAARIRRAPGRRWRRSYAWEIPPRADCDPVTVTNWRTEAELDAARIRFLASTPPLDCSPPFRLLRARGPEGESLILNAHHAAFDGHSCLLLLGMIADLYSGRGMTPAPDPELLGPGASLRLRRRGAGTAPLRADRAAERPRPRAGLRVLPARVARRAGRPAARRRAAGHSQRPARGRARRNDRQMERRAPGTAPRALHPDQRAGRRPLARRRGRAG